jgi:hypothetical protein
MLPGEVGDILKTVANVQWGGQFALNPNEEVSLSLIYALLLLLPSLPRMYCDFFSRAILMQYILVIMRLCS